MRLIALATLLAFGLALPAQEARVTETSSIPRAWKKLRPASDAATIHLHIGIKQEEDTLDELKRRLIEGTFDLRTKWPLT